MGALFGGIVFLFNEIFTIPIFNALMILYRLFGDFGLAIVVLTLIIKLILFPLTLKSLRSSKAMQALQPQIQEIRRKYAKDMQEQNVRTQALYKEYGINPLGGCLPTLVQFPVLYGMYFAFSNVLRSAPKDLITTVNHNLYPFITHFTSVNTHLNWFIWLKFLNPVWSWSIDLAQPEPYLIHILPIIAALATLAQLRMSMPKPVPTPANAKPAQPDPTASSMKMMQFIMPVFTGYIGWVFPSGLALYWIVSSVFQGAQQFSVSGWGSLFENPFKQESAAVTTSASSNGATASRKESVKEKLLVEDDGNAKGAMATATSGSVTSKVRPTNGSRPSSNGSSSQSNSRRSRSSSASARRRGSRSRR